MNEYNIKAIPTKYNGVQFRSRLEATWAAFFDLCEWDWDYEPIDLNGWIPDFMLKGIHYNIYIEVKPFTKLIEFDDVILKIANTGIEEHLLLLGSSPIENDEYGSIIGWCNEEHREKDFGYDFNPAVFSDHTRYFLEFKYKYDYYNSVMSYNQRLNDMHDGDGYNHDGDPIPLWKEAKNITQWIKSS